MGLVNTLKGKIKNKLIDYGINGVGNSKGRRVLMYHNIDLYQSRKYNSRFTGIKNFEKQICYFQKKFQLISLEDYFLKKSNSTKFELAITFDDGLQNNFKYALPILEKYKVPATFFVTGMNNSTEKILWNDLYDIYKSECDKTFEFNNIIFLKNKKTNNYFSNSNQSFQQLFKQDKRTMEEKIQELVTCLIDNKNDFRLKEKYSDYWKLMTDEQISKTAQSLYIKIGSHGMYHNNLGIQELSKSINELCLSKAYLEKLTNYEINSIGYPDGSYSRELIEEAYKIGFHYQCVSSYLHEEDKTDLRIVDRHEVSALKTPENIYRLGYSIVKPF